VRAREEIAVEAAPEDETGGLQVSRSGRQRDPQDEEGVDVPDR
jgi:hypothetical protein